MLLQAPSVNHIAFRQELIALLNKHAGHLDSKEMLALAAHLVGQLIAFQSKRMSGDEALNLVIANIEQGNQEATENARQTNTQGVPGNG